MVASDMANHSTPAPPVPGCAPLRKLYEKASQRQLRHAPAASSPQSSALRNQAREVHARSSLNSFETLSFGHDVALVMLRAVVVIRVTVILVKPTTTMPLICIITLSSPSLSFHSIDSGEGRVGQGRGGGEGRGA